MTVREYVSQKGWEQEYVLPAENKLPFMTVDVGFINSDGNEDETEFDIRSYRVSELEALFNDFCKENGLTTNTVLYVKVVNYAESLDDL